LWALAFAETVYIIKKNLMLAISIALVSTILYEAAQYFGIVSGTGDIWDVIFVVLALTIYFTYKRRCRNEKQ
jgi:steroid 5-alpha reductase family enzyme